VLINTGLCALFPLYILRMELKRRNGVAAWTDQFRTWLFFEIKVMANR